LYVRNYDTGTVLKIAQIDPIDYPNKALILSTDSTKLLIIEEHSAFILNTTTLLGIVAATTSEGLAFGTYTDLPSFIPQAKRLNGTTIELDEFPQFTLDADKHQPTDTITLHF